MRAAITCQGPDESRFPQDCGTDVYPGAAPGRLAQKRPAYPHKESLDALQQLKSKKIQFRSYIAGCGALVVYAGFELDLFVGWMLMILVLAVLGHIWPIKAHEYYSLPHARDADGDHRCIFCGGRGIWRKGEYRSDRVTAHCSKCQESLYVQ